MKLRDLRIDGFGKLESRIDVFRAGLNVVYGPNEAGKSTLSAAIVATLFGFERGDKDDWRPWSGARYATALTYELADGRVFEVRRDFDRDGKGVRVYDEHGGDASGECAVNRSINPGLAHLGISLDVFASAGYLAQGEATIDGARAERITHALARALDGGPREDAALGAVKRLDDALARFVGKRRATVNAPLRHLQDDLAEARARADEMRGRLRTLDGLRARLNDERQRAAELEAALREHERRGRALRAFGIRARLEALRDIRDDVAALCAERAAYDDVAAYPSYLVAALEEHYRDLVALEASAHARSDEATRGRFTPAQAAELEERAGDGGAMGDAAFAALESDAAAAQAARDEAALAAERAQAARRTIAGGGDIFGAAVTAATLVAVAAVVLAVVHAWPYAVATGLLAAVLAAFATSRGLVRRHSYRTMTTMQQSADEAVARERASAANVARVLEPFGARTVAELARRRERYHDLMGRRAEAARSAEAARETRVAASAAMERFDRVAAELVEAGETRLRTLEAAKAQEARRSARDGIDVRLSMLEVRRADVAGADDEFALESELAELLAEGVEPAASPGTTLRAYEAERVELARRTAESRAAAIGTAAELAAAEAHIGDLAALDERAAELAARIERLVRFEVAVNRAKTAIEERTREAHHRFARRLADYASTTFASVTGERYVDVRVDPTTLAVRARVPESGDIVDVDRLSAGTREQAYLVVRLAIARMFGEGLEPAPLLLDDPFAYWDEQRIERGWPILEAAAADTQVVVFTTSGAFARAAAARGAALIDLGAAGAAPLAISP